MRIVWWVLLVVNSVGIVGDVFIMTKYPLGGSFLLFARSLLIGWCLVGISTKGAEVAKYQKKVIKEVDAARFTAVTLHQFMETFDFDDGVFITLGDSKQLKMELPDYVDFDSRFITEGDWLVCEMDEDSDSIYTSMDDATFKAEYPERSEL